MPVMIIYCPVCGKNIKYYEKCPVCGYEKNRDYEIYPTLSPISGNHRSAGIKRQEHENKRIDERVQLLIYPRIKELTEQMKQAQDRLDKLKSGHTQPMNPSVETRKRSSSPGNTKTVVAASQKNTNESKKTSQSTASGEPEIKTGSIVKFGHYEQGNGVAPIEWRVLKVEENGILMITDKGIDCKPYNDVFDKVTWANCSLRKWLNKEFLNNAFTTKEKIELARTAPGNATGDQVFLLSIEEAKEYMPMDKDRVCRPTAYAKNQGAFVSTSTNCSFWWLRSNNTPFLLIPDVSDYAPFVVDSGAIYNYGNRVNFSVACVRPAIWIKQFGTK